MSREQAKPIGMPSASWSKAKRELAEVEARQREADRRAASAPRPTTAPPVSTAPSVAQEEASIRQTLANYERALEAEDIALFRRVKPNLTADEESRLKESFDTVDSHAVELSIENMSIESNSAAVTVTRRDIIVIDGRSQNGNERRQVFKLSKSGGGWVIDDIGS